MDGVANVREGTNIENFFLLFYKRTEKLKAH